MIRPRLVFWIAMGLIALVLFTGCTSVQMDKARKYAYLYCKVRDADGGIHNTVDAMVPVVGNLANVTVSAGCVLIESYSATKPEVTSLPPGTTLTGTTQ